MAPRNTLKNIIVSEKFRVNSEIILRNFLQDENANTYEFPSTLTNVERAWVHNYVKTLGLRSKSHGKEPTRSLVISKPNKNVSNSDIVTLTVHKDNVSVMREFVKKYPANKDKSDVYSAKTRLKQNATDTNMGQLTFGIPQMPTIALNNDLISFRMNLPIWPMREGLMESIVSNQVLIVCGETGSGKTTQIPQFILDYSASCFEKCRIICTQPRRISAVAVAERVSAERGEKSGQTVGFHIRLESCVGPKTVLVYCTNGILLRTLMSGDTCLNSLTHIIVDEIHERDRFSDFLLICLRECLVRYPHLRLILMSATIDVNTFKRYFNNAPVVTIPGRLHAVSECYLEDILKMTKYESQAMLTQKRKQKVSVAPLMDTPPVLDTSNISPDLKLEMEECIMECVDHGTDDAFAQFLQLILSEHAPVNFQHPANGYTGLMAASMHGNHTICVQLLHFGADIKLKSKEGCGAFDFACMKQHIECAEVLKHYETYGEQDTATQASIQSDDQEQKQLLDLYHSSVSDQVIDFDLLHVLLYHIHRCNRKGSILVFLSGFEDIITVKDRVLGDVRFNMVPFQLFTLHGHMQISDQHRVFNPLPGLRKIILSTNIAETSITIDDVVFVIDSGKVKEKCYDALTGVCSLQSAWISQAAGKQRAGRAGRTQPGICYHLFSKYRNHSMQAFATPEILRMPLHELCLQTKLLAPKETKIADFLARAIEAPSAMAVNSAIKHLQEIDALDDSEELTFLGQHLVDLPVEPRLAKMLLYSVIFKCVDPLLTIVAFLSYRDPFVLPSMHQQKSVAVNMRKQFALNSFSDHAILLRVFQAWQEARLSKSEKMFCSKYFVSSATMEMVVNIRSQLLAQLRASGFVKTRPPGDIRDLNEHANNWALIKAVLAAGLFPNVAYVNHCSRQIKTRKEKKVLIHSSSSLRSNDRGFSNADHSQSISKIPTDWLIYEELSRSGSMYNMRSITSITPLTVALFVDNSINNSVDRDGSDCDDEQADTAFVLNDWIMFEGDADLIRIVTSFRDKINYMIRKKITNPYRTYTGHDEAMLTVICAILAREDATIGFLQPPGVGQRPKIMMPNHYPSDSQSNVFHNKRQTMRRDGKLVTVADALYFNRVVTDHYNKYIPQDLAEEFEGQQETSETYFEVESVPMPYNQQPYIASQSADCSTMHMALLTQDFDSMNMCNNTPQLDLPQASGMNYGSSFYPQTSDYLDQRTSTGGQSDFLNNGITMDLDGACARDPPYAMALPYVMGPLYALAPSSIIDSPTIMDPSSVMEPAGIMNPPNIIDSPLGMMDASSIMDMSRTMDPCRTFDPYRTVDQSRTNDPSSTMDSSGLVNVRYSQMLPTYEQPTLEMSYALQRRNVEYTSFYIIKPASLQSVDMSISKRTWTFSPQLEKRLIKVLQIGRTVMLIFTVHGSGSFQGIARLLSGPSSELSHYNHNCPVEWLSRADVTFDQVKGFLNTSFSEGDELDPHTGITLWTMLTNCTPKAPVQMEPTNIPAGRPIKKSSRM